MTDYSCQYFTLNLWENRERHFFLKESWTADFEIKNEYVSEHIHVYSTSLIEINIHTALPANSKGQSRRVEQNNNCYNITIIL